jgi:HK97 family phage major capsid protein
MENAMAQVTALLKELKEGQVTKDMVTEIAEEIVKSQLAAAGERGIQFGTGPSAPAPGSVSKKAIQRPEAEQLDQVYLYGVLMGKSAQLVSPWVQETIGSIYEVDATTKAQDSAWHSALIPTGLSRQLQEDVELRLLVADKFRTIQMPTNPYQLPIKTGKTTAYHVAEGVSATVSSATTSYAQLSLEKLAVYTEFTYEVEADSIVPILPMLRADIVNVLARQMDDNVLNGTDTPATGQTAVYGTWDGLKTLATSQSTVASAAGPTFSSTDVLNMRSALGTRGVRISELVLFVSTDAYNDLLADTNVVTVDKFGPAATILRGQVASIYGVPVVLSEFVNTTSANQGDTLGLARTKDMVMVSTPAFLIGAPSNGGVLVEQDQNIVNQTRQLVASMRRDFQLVHGSSAAPSVAQRYI